MEPTEQNIPIPPAKKIQPHQVALWFAIGFVTFSYLSLVLFGTDLILEGFGLFVSCLVRPGIWLALHLGLNNVWSYLVIMAWGLMAWYLTYYIPVKLWMTSSRHMRMVLTSLVILCFITCGTYQCYSAKKPDWTSQGLNPDRPGFEPQAITLSGEYGKGRDIFFEIRMHGFDYYYARRWHGNDWKPGAWFHTYIACDGEGWSWGLHCSSIGTGGGGGGLACSDEFILPARRLWDKQHFIGANTNDLIAKQKQWNHRQEEFSDLVKVGRWLVPSHIHLVDDNGKSEDYFIKRIVFLPTPDTNWFEQVMAKYGHRAGFPLKDLNEPGVAPGKRQ